MNINLNNNSLESIMNILKLITLIFFILILIFIPVKSFTQVINGTIEFEGITRDYILFLPMNYNDMDSLPLILNLHGNNPSFDGGWQMNYTRMNMIADTAGFMVVYPTGISQDGEDGYWYTGVTDVTNGVGFIDALLDTLDDLYKVNNDQIYACGTSGGGAMSCKLACLLSHRIAAIANNAGEIIYGVAQNIEFNRPMPYLHIHGTEDPVVAYSAGARTVEFWQDINICSGPDTLMIPDINMKDNSTVEKITYSYQWTGCKVIFYRVINGGHTWPGAAYDIPSVGNTNKDINASSKIWNFFKQYKLSELSFPDHDIMLRSVIFDLKTLPVFMNFKPTALIQNTGSNNESEVPVAFVIDSSGSRVYESTQVFHDVNSLEKKEIVFDKSHTLLADHYDFMCTSLLASDVNAQNDTMKHRIAVTKLIDDFESGHDKQWISDYGWGVREYTEEVNGGHFVLYSKINPSYKDSDTTTITFFSSFNLSSLETAYMCFFTTYTFYDGDTGYVEVSTNQGKTWMITGNTFTGDQSEYQIAQIPLDLYTKPDVEELMVRFKIINNPGNDFPRWYIDDVMIHPNEKPSIAVKRDPSYVEKDHFILYDNYPNPFNRTTVIKYLMSHQQHLIIKIFNILGQEVLTLLDKHQPAGEYSITWNGRNNSGHEVNSGLYFCQIKTSNKIVTRKMLLLK